MTSTPHQPRASARRTTVVGAGPTGLLSALALASVGAEVTLVDAHPLADKTDKKDGRTVALLQPSIRLLRQLGLWEQLEPAAQPLRRLRIVSLPRGHGGPVDGDVTFAASDLGLFSFGSSLPVADLRDALASRVLATDGITDRTGAPVASVSLRGAEAVLDLAAGEPVRTDLVVGADGRGSIVRAASGIPVSRHPYRQTAITVAFAHEQTHNDTSIELHRPGGAFTMGPLPGRRSALVWVEHDHDAEGLLALPDAAFFTELDARVRPWLGPVHAVGARGSFPLVGMSAARLVGPRVALVGEAAHAMSPVGAQGLNTSLADVAALARAVAKSLDAGRPASQPDALVRYERERLPDIRARLLVTDGLARAVATAFPAMIRARGLGLRLVGSLPPLRRLVMRGLLEPRRRTTRDHL
jgi:2-octaprenyl-6-methoxyphenol hydroxylase